MLLPGCPCCAPVGCTCPGFYYGGTTILADTTNECCSPTKCFPCSVTMQLIPGNTWNGFYASLLTAADRAEIIAALSLTFVAPIYSATPVGYRYDNGSAVGARYFADLSIDQSVGCNRWRIDNLYNSISGSRYDASNNPIPFVTLSSGKTVSDWYFRALAGGAGTAVGGFSLSEWCGTSFDKTVAWFNSTSIFNGYVNVSDPSVPNSGQVRIWGTSVRYTW